MRVNVKELDVPVGVFVQGEGGYFVEVDVLPDDRKVKVFGDKVGRWILVRLATEPSKDNLYRYSVIK